jgi:hypothetical protein
VLQAKRSEFHLDARSHQTQRESQQVRLRERLRVLNEKLEHALPVPKHD